jgi:hypothetical protein
VESIPENVIPGQYCYTSEGGFFIDPNYKRVYTPEERLAMVEQQSAETQKAVLQLLGL